MWNTFYRDYLNADFPRLIIRYEDLLLHADEIMPQICECVGAELTNTENGVSVGKESAKKHMRSKDDIVGIIMRYGSIEKKTERHTKGDIVYANENLAKDLMEAFQYKYPKIEK